MGSLRVNSAPVREKRFYSILSVLLFAFGGVVFWEFLYEFCNMVGAVVSGTPSQALAEAGRMLPVILCAAASVVLNACAFGARRAAPEKRARRWRGGGLAAIVLGAAVTLSVLLGLMRGTYFGLVEGNPTLLFPLDVLLVGLGIAAYGVFGRVYAKRLDAKTPELPAGPKGRWDFFHCVSVMITLSSFGACVYGFWTLDWAHGDVFFNVVLWLNYFAAVLQASLYRFVYAEGAAEKRREIHRKLAGMVLVWNVVLLGLYFLAVQVMNEAPNANAFGLLPIEFTASFHAFPVVMLLNNVLGPLAALLKSFRKKA